ncbi:MAG: diguanylate cyclase domain-containing protein [Lachnospiraceae bacterium]
MKSMIVKKMVSIVMMIMLLILAVIVIIQIHKSQKDMDEEAYTLFEQVEQILAKNTEEEKSVIEEYNQLCLNYADAVAYILSEDPAIMDDIDELKKIAGYLQIDEIHIFDQNGEIVRGTQPEYYGLTVYSGEQISFFAQMLEDKSLRLCQEVTPNTAEAKEMQYAAVWSEDGEFIVQVGITPYRVLEVISKNQLSYIFSLLTTENGATLYAIDLNTEEILGSTDERMLGANLMDLGISMEQAEGRKSGFHARIKGENSYCVATVYQSVLLLRVCPNRILYQDLLKDTLMVAICLTVIAIFMVFIMVQYLNKYIIQGIYDINQKLTVITEGKLDESVDVHTTPEFEQLSHYINEMIKSILSTTDKMSYVLDHAMLVMGVYEYNSKMRAVRTTKQIKNILCLDDQEADRLFADHEQFESYIERMKKNPVKGFENIYQTEESEERYIRIESFRKDENYLGILMDVTESVLRSRKLEKERNIDSLTGIYNRRGLEENLEELLEQDVDLKYSALVMLDADGLKQINDLYGHKAGDRYLCEIAKIMKDIRPEQSIIARQGGDEFVLFYYGCETEEELLGYIHELGLKRDRTTFMPDEEQSLPVRYSFGYVLCHDTQKDYSGLILEADRKMYEEKLSRKQRMQYIQASLQRNEIVNAAE